MATRVDIERMATAIRARHGYTVDLGFISASSKLPYHISVFDPRSTRTIEIRPASLVEALWFLRGVADGLYLAAGRLGNYPH